MRDGNMVGDEARIVENSFSLPMRDGNTKCLRW